MKRVIVLCLALLLLWGGLSACSGPLPSQPAGIQLWFIQDVEQWQASTTALSSVPYQGEETVPGLLAALFAGPTEGSGLSSPFPEGTRLVEWQVDAGVLRLKFSRAYGELTGIDQTLANYCITLTMTQLPEISGVSIFASGGTSDSGNPPILTADDVVFSGAEEVPVELSAVLYFRRAGENRLGYESRVFRLTESELPTMAVLEALLAGPEDEALSALIPDGVEIYSARVDEGICYVDFSAALMEMVPANEENQILILSSVVETLCELEPVKTVQILVEGKTAFRYGMVDISQPLEPSGGST